MNRLGLSSVPKATLGLCWPGKRTTAAHMRRLIDKPIHIWAHGASKEIVWLSTNGQKSSIWLVPCRELALKWAFWATDTLKLPSWKITSWRSQGMEKRNWGTVRNTAGSHKNSRMWESNAATWFRAVLWGGGGVLSTGLRYSSSIIEWLRGSSGCKGNRQSTSLYNTCSKYSR